MFAIYDEQGRIFRNTLEELYRVPAIQRREPARSIDGDEGKESFRNYLTGEAIHAYRKVISARSDEPIHHAYQVMKRPVTTVYADTPVGECYALLEAKNIRQLPVVSPEERPLGLFSLERLFDKLVKEGGSLQDLEGLPVRQLVTLPLLTADPLADIRRIARVMYDRRLNCIPITNEADMFVGIVSRTDLIFALANTPTMAIRA